MESEVALFLEGDWRMLNVIWLCVLYLNIMQA